LTVSKELLTLFKGLRMGKSQLRLSLSIFNIVCFAAVVVINTLAITIPLGGKTTGQLSDQYSNLFVPSGLTFSIWGIIYILLGLYTVCGLIDSIKKAERSSSFVDTIGILFIITCIANVGWILSWQFERLLLSLACMLILLIALILIYNRLGIGLSKAKVVEKYLVHMPMSVYFGWITIATIANVTAILVAYKWDRFGLSEEFWAVALIGIGIILGLVILFQRKDIFYALVVDWAILGILIKRIGERHIVAQGVIITSIIGIVVLSLGILLQIIRGKVHR
jgi:hypothetical protein